MRSAEAGDAPPPSGYRRIAFVLVASAQRALAMRRSRPCERRALASPSAPLRASQRAAAVGRHLCIYGPAPGASPTRRSGLDRSPPGWTATGSPLRGSSMGPVAPDASAGNPEASAMLRAPSAVRRPRRDRPPRSPPRRRPPCRRSSTAQSRRRRVRPGCAGRRQARARAPPRRWTLGGASVG